MGTTWDVYLQRFRAAVTTVWGWEFPSPKVVSERAKTDTFGYRKYGENLQLLLEIIYCAKKSRKFWHEFTYLNSSQITMLIKLAKQLLPT